MNRERARELLPIIQAFAEGKTVQARLNGVERWDDVTMPCWHNDHEYRIKPEPMEIWVNIYPSKAVVYRNQRCAVQGAGESCMYIAKHFREVTE